MDPENGIGWHEYLSGKIILSRGLSLGCQLRGGKSLEVCGVESDKAGVLEEEGIKQGNPPSMFFSKRTGDTKHSLSPF